MKTCLNPSPILPYIFTKLFMFFKKKIYIYIYCSSTEAFMLSTNVAQRLILSIPYLSNYFLKKSFFKIEINSLLQNKFVPCSLHNTCEHIPKKRLGFFSGDQFLVVVDNFQREKDSWWTIQLGGP